MKELFLFDFALTIVIVIMLILAKKKIKTEKGQNIIFLVAPVMTILCHYSSLLYHCITDGLVMEYLECNPNLLLPIYPCNVVMWCCFIYGLSKNKSSKFAKFLEDYIFWFGIFAGLVGMFVNIDFINDPNLANYDVTKGIVAHGFMVFNILLFPCFGKIKIDLPKNMRHIVISMVMMFLLGSYCNLLFETLVSKDMAYIVNSMFIIHSPFEGLSFVRFPVICLVALVLYYFIFQIAEILSYKKEERWIKRYFKKEE